MKTCALLTLLSIVTLSGAQSAADYFTLDPPNLTVNDFNAGAEIKLALKNKPDAPKCSVYVEAPSLSFDKCALDYSPENYNVAQALKIVPIPFQTAAQEAREIPLNLKVWCPGSPAHNQTVAYTVKRGALAAGQCIVSGDPHYKTFDQDIARTYHYQGAGIFYLVRSPSLTVQAIQSKCLGKTTCVSQLAVRYGKTVFVVDGTAARGSSLKKVTELEAVTVSTSVEGSIENYNFALTGGSDIKVRIGKFDQFPYMDVTITLATHYYRQTDGLCGKYDGDATNDYTGSDGAMCPQATCFQESSEDPTNEKPNFDKTNLHRFAQSYKVPDEDNIFLCGGNCRGTNTYPVQGQYNECQIPPLKEPEPPIYVPPIPNGYQPIIDLPKYEPKQPTLEVPGNVTAPAIPANIVDVAARGCLEVIKEIADCAPFANVKGYQGLCEFDIRANIPAQVAYDLYKAQYEGVCVRAMLSKLKEPKPEERKKYAEIARQRGYGRNPCTCGEDARCTERGCVCREPGQVFSNGKCNLPAPLPKEYYPPPPAAPQPKNVAPAPQVPPQEPEYYRIPLPKPNSAAEPTPQPLTPQPSTPTPPNNKTLDPAQPAQPAQPTDTGSNNGQKPVGSGGDSGDKPKDVGEGSNNQNGNQQSNKQPGGGPSAYDGDGLAQTSSAYTVQFSVTILGFVTINLMNLL